MRPGILIGLCALALQTAICARAELEPKAVAVEPGVVMPGQPITLRWYFTGNKVVVSGGRFGKGTVVTGKTQITDRPEKTTRYAFDVWYNPPPDPAKPEVKPAQVHVQYTAVAAVDKLTSFHGPEGFDVRLIKGWRTDSFSPEPGSKVYFFQEEEDSVERVAVAVVPIKEGETVATVMEKVRGDVPSHYTKVEFVSLYDMPRKQDQAQITHFKGIDSTHPNTRTESIVVVYIHGNKAYVASGRTYADKFAERGPLLDGLVRSLSFSGAIASK
ncbi:MAG TPA: hypothetical protein VKT77_06510 [Chthonomonadaceae bacterium]|nr:hypothetical protein [Chthonomonadaceae bacterium]